MTLPDGVKIVGDEVELIKRNVALQMFQNIPEFRGILAGLRYSYHKRGIKCDMSLSEECDSVCIFTDKIVAHISLNDGRYKISGNLSDTWKADDANEDEES